MDVKINQPKISLVQMNGELIEIAPSRVRSLRSAATSRMHMQKGLGGKFGALTPNRSNHRRPRGARNPLALPPLLNGPGALADVVGHFGNGLPTIENVFEVRNLHNTLLPGDNLSRQERTALPVTKSGKARTIRPMSRATTPTTFKKEFCQRLRAARVMAGLDQPTFAKMLGLLPNTYGKYENRSLLPHYLVPVACEILGITPDRLYPPLKEKEKKRIA